MDTRDDEKERGITIKSTGVSLYYETELETGNNINNKKKFFNLYFKEFLYQKIFILIFRYKIRLCYQSY